MIKQPLVQAQPLFPALCLFCLPLPALCFHFYLFLFGWIMKFIVMMRQPLVQLSPCFLLYVYSICPFLFCVFVFICVFWMDYEINCNDQVGFGSSLGLASCSMSISFAPSSSVFSFLFVFFGWIMKFLVMMRQPLVRAQPSLPALCLFHLPLPALCFHLYLCFLDGF